MAAKFDNLEDVQGKFAGTICYYDGRPVYVKNTDQKVLPDGSAAGFWLYILYSATGRGKWVELSDPLFDYKNFNIGYANEGNCAAWWYRKPNKQWKQGLKKEQLNYKMTNMNMNFAGFQFAPAYIDMLQGKYPTLEECMKLLLAEQLNVVAFHKDFAASWDNIHQDFFIEYRGQKIGNTLSPNFKEYKLAPQFAHLKETVEEVLSNVR